VQSSLAPVYEPGNHGSIVTMGEIPPLSLTMLNAF